PALKLGGSLGTGPVTVDRLTLTGEHITGGARGLIREAGELALALDWQAEGPFGLGPLEIEGAATGEGALTGPLARPRLDLTADFARVAAGPLTLTNADLTLSFRRGADASDGRIALVSGSNYGPARASGVFRLARGGVQMSNVALDAGGLRAQGAIALTGSTPASADLSFTAGPGAFLSAGRAEGRVRLTETAAAGVAVLDVSGRNVRFAGASYVIQSLELDGQGSLERLPFTIDARVAGPTPLALYGSGVSARPDTAQTLTRSGGDPPADVVRGPRGPTIGLDMTVRAPGPAVKVTGRGLNVFLSLNARVTGALTAPNLSGTARVVRGDYEFGGKRFVFDDTGSVTLSTNPENIRLNLSALREDPALTATIRVTGTAARPDIGVTSSPARPQDEVLAQVLFGRSASQLSAFEAAQLASGVASLAGGSGFDIIGNLRELAGLDRLSFGGEASALTVAGGRYISDDVYLEIIGGGEGGAGVNVEWQVQRNLALTSSVGGQGQASLSIRWRRESRPTRADRTDRRPNRRD
ncbi:MAG: translocation/assembly module TamB domain-containing protein, partial [Brevundimonas sp.]